MRDEQAITATDEAYGGAVMQMSMRILGDRADAEENKYDTLLAAWNAIPPERPVYFLSWLLKVCRRKALDRLDKRKAKKRDIQTVRLTEELAACIPDRKAEERIREKELSETINRFLSGLPQETRDILAARYFGLCTVPQIAHATGCSESKIKSVLSRTGKRLREFLKNEGYGR